MERTEIEFKIRMVCETFRKMIGRMPSQAELLQALGNDYEEALQIWYNVA